MNDIDFIKLTYPEEIKEIMKTSQKLEEENVKAQQEATKKIQVILEENGLVLVVEHLIKAVPKK